MPRLIKQFLGHVPCAPYKRMDYDISESHRTESTVLGFDLGLVDPAVAKEYGMSLDRFAKVDEEHYICVSGYCEGVGSLMRTWESNDPASQ